MRTVGERGHGREAPAAAAVEDGGAEQSRAVIDGDHRVCRGGALQQGASVIRGIAAVERTQYTADVVGYGGDGGRRWRSDIDVQGEVV